MTEPNPDNPTAEFTFSFGSGDVKVVLEFHFSDNAEDFLDPETIVNGMSAAILRELM